jgi:hypothetical protein
VMRAMRVIQLGTLATGMILARPPVAQAAEASPDPCQPVMARLLPGEYNYCVATRDWQAGHNREANYEARYAASYGEKRAQFALGVDYFNGRRGLKADRATGLAWLTLAAERKDPYYVSILASARSLVTPDEQRRAEELVAQMRPNYGDAFAVDRAETHYRDQLWIIRDQVWEALAVHHDDPWSSNTAVVIDGLGAVQPMMALRTLQHIGDTYFEGWGGHVTVGQLVPVTDPPGTNPAGTAPVSSHP